jgi:hypothetical protein
MKIYIAPQSYKLYKILEKSSFLFSTIFLDIIDIIKRNAGNHHFINALILHHGRKRAPQFIQWTFIRTSSSNMLLRIWSHCKSYDSHVAFLLFSKNSPVRLFFYIQKNRTSDCGFLECIFCLGTYSKIFRRILLCT